MMFSIRAENLLLITLSSSLTLITSILAVVCGDLGVETSWT